MARIRSCFWVDQGFGGVIMSWVAGGKAVFNRLGLGGALYKAPDTRLWVVG
jgi:hypothetical protein